MLINQMVLINYINVENNLKTLGLLDSNFTILKLSVKSSKPWKREHPLICKYWGKQD